MIKIAFFDIDGTLLKIGSKEPSKKTISALKQLQEKGILLCMATGRSYPAIPTFEGIDFDVLLTFNGSYVRNKEHIIFKNPLDNEDKNKVIQNLKNMNRAIAISNEKIIIANGTDKDLEEYFAFGNEEVVVSEDFDILCRENVYQIMCSCVKEEYEYILHGTHNTQITAWWDKAVDIIPLNCGKGNAVSAVLEYYGFTKDESIAFGDGKNDIEMLEAVGMGIAMGNAKNEVKKRADFICQSVENEGVYYYCLENNLINPID
ncbi:TPA: HAD family hydrolase [Clostridioides difficile]